MKSRSMQRSLGLVLVLGMAFLPGCGGDDETPSGNGTASGGTSGTGGVGGGAGSGGTSGGSGGAATGGAAGSAGAPSTGGTAGSVGAAGSGGSGGFDCEIPDSQLFDVVHAGATLTFSTSHGAEVEVGFADDPAATMPTTWVGGPSYTLPTAGTPYSVKLFARMTEPACADDWFQHVYDVRDEYSPAAGEAGAFAVAMDDAAIQGWASGFVSPVVYGTDVDDPWKTPDEALGAASGDALDIVCLGHGGSIVLTFDPPITDGVGADLAVFENSINSTFLELAHVEVSSDGVTFVRFDSAYLGNDPVGAFAGHSPTLFDGLAGKHMRGWGTPFDLDLLRYRPAVQRGDVDLSSIRYVRIVDVVGDGSFTDSFGHPIYDPHRPVGSGGFDLEAVAVLNAGNG